MRNISYEVLPGYSQTKKTAIAEKEAKQKAEQQAKAEIARLKALLASRNQ